MPEKKEKNMKTVWVVVYSDTLNGTVNLDVFETKEKAGEQMEKVYKHIDSFLYAGQKIDCADYTAGILSYFQVKDRKDEMIYECFVRAEMVQ